MVSKAARQEPTPKGYHTGMRVAARESLDERCVLSRKSRHSGSRSLSLHKYGMRRNNTKEGRTAMTAAATKVERFGEESINVCISLSDITRKER